MTTLLLQGDTLAKKAGNLIALANENGGRDNITVVLLQNNKMPQQVKPTRPDHTQQAQPAAVAGRNEPPKPSENPETSTLKAPKRNYWFTALVILCLILLGTTIFLYLQRQHLTTPVSTANQSPKQKLRNRQEKLLQDALDHAPGDTLVLSDSVFKSPVLISDTLRLRKDTLYVIAKGIVLQADSGYKGAAITMLPQSKLMKLDSLQFKGFATAIAISDQALLLKNVTFSNCLLPVQNSFHFPDRKPVNAVLSKIGTLKGNTIKTADSKNGAE